MSQEICPITRSAIEPGDVFHFQTKSGNSIRYSAVAIQSYLNHSGKLTDPITREKMNHIDLERLQKITKKKLYFYPRFKNFWNKIVNISVRREAEVFFNEYRLSWEGEETEAIHLLSKTVSLLLLLKNCVSAAAYRRFGRHCDGPALRKVKSIVELMDPVISVDVEHQEHLSQLRFKRISSAKLPDLLEGALEELPSFDIMIDHSVTACIRDGLI